MSRNSSEWKEWFKENKIKVIVGIVIALALISYINE